MRMRDICRENERMRENEILRDKRNERGIKIFPEKEIPGENEINKQRNLQ